ncbi:MAG TPA: aspartate--tRNA(Asn) ligase [Candidatus Monoglobus merdigallinarum]|uniref:Aspartate--tRNA ligase n=1 Tax=Candidatus Monoglobus merdigallinarum TaxID=2838698 RepID=A0A9D1PRJ4_9FIRM|nr:aspartate--tRNA(Asn) ligase [Candidatus Monoglobus merdigallinarum]
MLDFNRYTGQYDIESVIGGFESGALSDGDSVEVEGMIHRIRAMKSFAFFVLRTQRNLVQCVYEPKEGQKPVSEFNEEDSVRLRGKLVKDARSALGFEIHISDIKVLSSPAENLPIVINKKKLDCNVDIKLDYRPVSLRNPHERAALRIVDGIINAFRTFMHSEGFTEFVPPKIVSAGAEGGADMFEVDYFGEKALLNQSPQMYKQMMVGVFKKVFTVAPVFRAEKHSTTRHINEFEGLDFEMGFIDSFEDIMAVEARFMKYMFEYLSREYAPELSELGVALPEINDIPQFKFMEIKEIIAGEYNREFRNPNDLDPEEERLIGEYVMNKYSSPLVFITHYPSKKRPFYAMDDPEDPKYTLSFDLLLNGSEVTTGGQRIHDYNMQLEKINKRGMDAEEFKDFLMMHKYGMPPHGGLGIGLERLAMKLLGVDNIRTVTAFPRDIGRINP